MSYTYTTFTASGTWDRAAAGNPILVDVLVVAGGGGGGGNRGGGGGAGGVLIAYNIPVSANQTITIGGGGSGGGDGVKGGDGGNSSFGALVVATGGGGGATGDTGTRFNGYFTYVEVADRELQLGANAALSF